MGALPWCLGDKESAGRRRRQRFNSWSGKVPRASEQRSAGATSTEARAPRAHAPLCVRPPPGGAGALHPEGSPSRVKTQHGQKQADEIIFKKWNGGSTFKTSKENMKTFTCILVSLIL